MRENNPSTFPAQKQEVAVFGGRRVGGNGRGPQRGLCQRVRDQPAASVPNVLAVETLYCSVQSPKLTVI